MPAPAIDGARLTVAAPTRKPRRFGLFSVVDPVDSSDPHWMLGGLTADGEECSSPITLAGLNCGPTPDKTSRSWFSDIEGGPWLSYMYETCKTVGRYSEAAAKLRTRFLAAEQSAVESGFQRSVLVDEAHSIGSSDSIPQAIGMLEASAAEQYGGQIILHLPFVAAEEASRGGLLTRVGDHLETVAGNLVSVGNYTPDDGGGDVTTPILYATGAMSLYRGPITEVGPVLGRGNGDLPTNDYYALIERPYAALVDCLVESVIGTLCSCAPSGGGPV